MHTSSEPRPVVLPRSTHCISRSRIDPDALKVLYRLHHSGYKAYLVGGSVRDLLLGKSPKDFDVGTDAHPAEIRRLFRNCRIIGRRFRIAHIYFKGNKIIEVSTFRRNVPEEGPEGVEGEAAVRAAGTSIYGQPHEDAFRRDITINGLFYDIGTFSIIDYVGGMADLKDGIIRAIGDPERKFVEDPVRMIRACRHAARTGFLIEEKTYRAILAHADLVTTCNRSRLLEEFQKDLTGGASRRSFELLKETGLLAAYLPAFSEYLDNEPLDRTCFYRPGWVWNALEYLDRLEAEGPETDSAFYFIPLVFPLLEKRLLERAGASDQEAAAAVEPTTVYESIRELTAPLALPRKYVERLTTTWIVMDRLEKALQKGFIPASLQKRPYFPFLLAAYRLKWISAGLGPETVEERIREGLRKGTELSRSPAKRRRRRRRPRRRAGQERVREGPSKL